MSADTLLTLIRDSRDSADRPVDDAPRTRRAFGKRSPVGPALSWTPRRPGRALRSQEFRSLAPKEHTEGVSGSHGSFGDIRKIGVPPGQLSRIPERPTKPTPTTLIGPFLPLHSAPDLVYITQRPAGSRGQAASRPENYQAGAEDSTSARMPKAQGRGQDAGRTFQDAPGRPNEPLERG